MDIKGIDITEMDRQRAKAIKDSGRYIELNVLIGTEDEKFNGHDGRMPVITNRMYGCGPLEIACMYVTLDSIMKYLENEYPTACAISKIGINTTEMDIIESPIKEPDDKNKED